MSGFGLLGFRLMTNQLFFFFFQQWIFYIYLNQPKSGADMQNSSNKNFNICRISMTQMWPVRLFMLVWVSGINKHKHYWDQFTAVNVLSGNQRKFRPDIHVSCKICLPLDRATEKGSSFRVCLCGPLTCSFFWMQQRGKQVDEESQQPLRVCEAAVFALKLPLKSAIQQISFQISVHCLRKTIRKSLFPVMKHL